MVEERAVVDFAGSPVRVGSLVRIRYLSASYLEGIDGASRQRVQSMIGQSLMVNEIDSTGLAWVTALWHGEGGEVDGEGIGLAADEMELLESGPAA